MTDQIKVVTFTTRATPGTQDITDPGITGTFRAAIFFFSGFTSDSTDNTHGLLGCGFCVNNSNSTLANAAIGIQIENGVSVSDNGTRNSNVDCISIAAGGTVATANIQAQFSAAISGGVRLNFSTTTVQAKCVAILFAGLADANINQIQPTTTATAESCKSIAGGAATFRPNLLVWLTADHPGGSINEAEAQPNLGFTIDDGVPTEKMAAINFDESNPTDTDGYVRSDSSFGWLNLTTRVAEFGGATAISATGFTHQSNLLGGIRCSYLALKFSDALTVTTKNLAVTGSTGTQSFSLGFQPQLVFGMSTLMTSQDTLTDGATASAFGYFAFTSTYQRAYTVREQEGLTLGTTAASSRQEDVAVLTYTHLGAIAQRATLSQMTSTGFDLSFTTATAGLLTVLAIGAGTQTIVSPNTERISDGLVLNLISRRPLSETERISDGAILLAQDALPDLAPAGWVYEAGAARGTILEGGGGPIVGWVYG